MLKREWEILSEERTEDIKESEGAINKQKCEIDVKNC